MHLRRAAPRPIAFAPPWARARPALDLRERRPAVPWFSPEPAPRHLGLRAARRFRPDPWRRCPVPDDGRSSPLDRKLREHILDRRLDDRQPEDRLGQSSHGRIQRFPARQPRPGAARPRWSASPAVPAAIDPWSLRGGPLRFEKEAGQAGDHPRAQRRRHRQLGDGRGGIDPLAPRPPAASTYAVGRSKIPTLIDLAVKRGKCGGSAPPAANGRRIELDDLKIRADGAGRPLSITA